MIILPMVYMLAYKRNINISIIKLNGNKYTVVDGIKCKWQCKKKIKIKLCSNQ